MFERLEESTRVPDVRGVLTVASAYAAAGAIVETQASALSALLIPGVFVAAAGWFAVRGGRGWIRGTARKSALAVGAVLCWYQRDVGIVDADLFTMAEPRMEFAIVEGPCFGGPGLTELAVAILIASAVGGIGAIPVGWAARRLFLLRKEDG